MKSYDIVIIGAGPAGLNCAKFLAKTNQKVLVIEKNKQLGQKICAGGISDQALEYLNLPKKLIEHQSDKVKISGKFASTTIKLGNDFIYTINRQKLAKWQASLLKNTSVKIKTSAQVTNISANYIVINNSEKIGYRYLVGTDGGNSIVRRHLGINNKNIELGMQYILPSKKFKDIEFFFDSNLFGMWYAWIFPHKNYVSIGVGTNPSYFPIKTLRKNFDAWLKKKGIDTSKAKFEASIINADFQGYQFGNVFLAGEAAGLTSEVTGEGIYPALISGEEIAKLITSRNYNPLGLKEIIRQKEIHTKIYHALLKSKKFLLLEHEIGVLLLKSSFFANIWKKLFFH